MVVTRIDRDQPRGASSAARARRREKASYTGRGVTRLRPVTPALPQPTFEAEAPCRYIPEYSVG